jgi:heat shock protein HtpX
MQMLKVVGLMTGLTVLMVGFGSYFGGTNGAILFLVIAAVMNFGMYWFSDRAVLKMYRARVLGAQDAPDLYQMVDRLRQAAGLPMPKLALAPSEQPNAFATGRNPANAVVCVTAGIVRLLPPRELEGVIAHELAHVKHRHMLVGTIAATMAGAIATIASIAKWGMIFGGIGGRDDRGQNPFAMLIMVIVAPIAAMIVQMAISRQNEYQADATAARLTRDPGGLASALQRIEGYAHQIPMAVNPAAAQLAIINPFAGRRPAFAGLFNTHPSTEERIARLRQITL